MTGDNIRKPDPGEYRNQGKNDAKEKEEMFPLFRNIIFCHNVFELLIMILYYDARMLDVRGTSV